MGRLLSLLIGVVFIGMCVAAAGRGGQSASARPTATPVAKATAAPPAATPQPDRCTMMARLDEAWAKSDWPAAVSAAEAHEFILDAAGTSFYIRLP